MSSDINDENMDERLEKDDNDSTIADENLDEDEEGAERTEGTAAAAEGTGEAKTEGDAPAEA